MVRSNKNQFFPSACCEGEGESESHPTVHPSRSSPVGKASPNPTLLIPWKKEEFFQVLLSSTFSPPKKLPLAASFIRFSVSASPPNRAHLQHFSVFGQFHLPSSFTMTGRGKGGKGLGKGGAKRHRKVLRDNIQVRKKLRSILLPD